MTTAITVTSEAELKSALSQAVGGETILLAAGDYGKLSLKNIQFASDVTIKSADPNAMASFSEVYLTNVSNIKFDEIVFDYTYTQGDRNHTTKFLISQSSNVTIDNSVFDGDFASGTGTSADGTGFGKGLVIRDSNNIDVTNTEFHSWWKALGASRSSDIDFIGNNIHTIRSDGISLGEVQNVLIEGNYIHDFGGAAGSGDHRDMIQIQRSNGTGSDNITIKNNILDIGAGDYTQGIWAGADKAVYSDPTDWNHNLVIENNVLYNAHANGIAVHMIDGLTINNNTLIAVPTQQTGGVATPKIIVGGGSQNVTIEQNATPSVVGYNGQSHWTVQNNAIIQNNDPSQPGYYDTQFVYHATSAADGYNQYGVVTGSTVDQLDAGSSIVDGYPMDMGSWSGSAPSNGGGSGTVTAPANPGATVTPPDDTTTSPTPPDTGASAPADGSGSTTTPNDDASTPTTPDSGASAPTSPDTGNSAPVDPGNGSAGSGASAAMVFDDFILDIAGLPGNGQATLRDDAQVVDTANGPVVHFDGDKDQLKIGRLQQFENSDQLAFAVEFARDEADGSAQRLIWNKGHIGLTIVDDGLKAHVRNNDGKFHEGFYVADLGLNDTQEHEIVVMADQVADRLQVLVDGQVVLDRTDIDLDFSGGREWGWDIGFSHGRYADGDLGGFAIDDDVQFVDPLGGNAGDFLA